MITKQLTKDGIMISKYNTLARLVDSNRAVIIVRWQDDNNITIRLTGEWASLGHYIVGKEMLKDF